MAVSLKTVYLSPKAGAATLGGMYTEQGLKRISESLDLKSEVLAKLYPTFQDRFVCLISGLSLLLFASGELTARPPARGHRKGDWGPSVKLGTERVGVSKVVGQRAQSLHCTIIKNATNGPR